MAKQTFLQMVHEDKDLSDEIVDTPMEIVDDLVDLQVGTAVKRTIAAPIRVVKSVFDWVDF